MQPTDPAGTNAEIDSWPAPSGTLCCEPACFAQDTAATREWMGTFRSPEGDLYTLETQGCDLHSPLNPHYECA